MDFSEDNVLMIYIGSLLVLLCGLKILTACVVLFFFVYMFWLANFEGASNGESPDVLFFDALSNLDPENGVLKRDNVNYCVTENETIPSKSHLIHENDEKLQEDYIAVNISMVLNLYNYLLLEHIVKIKSSLFDSLKVKIKTLSYVGCKKQVNLELAHKFGKVSEDYLKNIFYELTSGWDSAVIELGEEQLSYYESHKHFFFNLFTLSLKKSSKNLNPHGLLHLEKNKLNLLATSSDEAVHARNCLEKYLFCCSVELEEKEFLVTDVWKKFKDDASTRVHVKEKYCGSNETRIVLVGNNEEVLSYLSILNVLIREHSKVIEYLKINRNIAEFWNLHFKDMIERLQDDLTVKLLNESVKIHGPKNIVALEVDRLKELRSKVSCESIEIKQPGLKAKLFTEEENQAKEIIEKTKNEKQCLIIFGDKIKNQENLNSSTTSINSHESNDISTPDLDHHESTTDGVLQASAIKVIKGNIVNCKDAEVLVNGFISIRKARNSKDLSKLGRISKSFSEAGKEPLQSEFENGQIPREFGSPPMVTKCHGSLTGKRVFHTYISNNRSERSLKLMKKAILLCLVGTAKEKYESIAFPTMGCGKLGYTIKDFCRCLYEAENEFRVSKEFRNLKICLYCLKDDQRYEDFLSMPDKLYRTNNVLQKSRSFELSNQHEMDCVVFTIYSMNSEDLNVIEDSIRNAVDSFYTEVIVEHEMISLFECISKESSDKLSELLLYDFSISGEKKEIRFLTLKSVSEEIKNSICSILDEENEKCNYPLYVKTTHGVEAYLKCLIRSQTVACPLYWGKYREIASNQELKILKYPLTEGSDVYTAVKDLVMKTWISSKVGKGRDAENLSHSTIEIQKIYIVENPQLFYEYKNFQKNLCHKALDENFQIKNLSAKGCKNTDTQDLPKVLEDNLVKEVNECFLFHGTKENNTDNIMRGGISIETCSDNAMFGKGAYFAESSTKADQYSDSRNQRTPLGTKLYMFVTRVLLGESYICKTPKKFMNSPCFEDSCYSKREFRRTDQRLIRKLFAPLLPLFGDCNECQDSSHKMADSVVGTHRDNGSKLLFREFVVYKQEQSYPEFLIEYIRK